MGAGIERFGRERISMGFMLTRATLTSALFLVLASAAPVGAITIVINNGLAPPNPDNVIDSDLGQTTNVAVQDFQPGDPTSVELVVGGRVGEHLTVSGSSSITMSGGGRESASTPAHNNERSKQ
jgi:hypothetical protein